MEKEEVISLLLVHLGLFGQGEWCQSTRNTNLDKKIIDCVFLDYAFHNMRYRFLIISFGVPDMHVGRIIESKDAQFF
jgi:hypothetical protein